MGRPATFIIATLMLFAGCSKPAAAPAVRSAVAGVSFSSFATASAGQRSRLIITNSGVLLSQPDSGGASLIAISGPTIDGGTISERMASVLHSRTAPGIRAGIRGDDGGLILYAGGTDGRRSLAGLWVYRSAGENPAQAVDADALALASGLGATIDLADAQLVRTSGGVMLCLVQSDAAAFLRLPEGSLQPGAPVRLVFSAVKVDGEPLRLSPQDTFFAGPDSDLRLMRNDGSLLAIDRAGNARPLPADGDRPAMSVPPLSLASRGGQARQLSFFPEPGETRDVLTLTPNLLASPVRYPAVILSDDQRTAVLDRDAIIVRPGFPVHALRITAWCQDPASGDVIAYDAFSGEIMRMLMGND